MNALELRNKYLDFFERHGHKVIPSAPLIPENDPSVLFNTAGMQPLVPYTYRLSKMYKNKRYRRSWRQSTFNIF